MGNMRMRKNTLELRLAALTMAVLLIAMVIANWAQAEQLDKTQLQIAAVYERAFYESSELLNGLQLNLRKLLVSGTGAQEQVLLSSIARQAQGIRENLSLLPMGQQAVADALRFVNQVGDYAVILAEKIAAGGAIAADDWMQLDKLSAALNEMSLRLNEILARLTAGESIFTAGDFAIKAENLALNDAQPAVEYPVLLYDGPFSEGRKNMDFAALLGERVDAVQAEAMLAEFAERAVGAPAECIFSGESNIPVECWEFIVHAGEYIMSAGVTKIGGHVLYMLPENDVVQRQLEKEACIEIGRDFLREEGFGEMTLSYYRAFDGILTVNYAAVQENVVLYPDLVKLQISMKDGAIIGMEASNYYANHIARELPSARLDVAEATDRVSDVLTIESVRLCVIPLDAGEALCYEFSARKGEEGYLVYIDASTGLEREIMQLVDSGDGIIAQ